MIEQWQELKETIIELRDSDGTGTQQDVCKFLANYMDVLEKNMSGSESSTGSKLIARDDAINMIKEIAEYHTGDSFNADRVIENIKRLPSVKPQDPKWVSILERMPEEDEEYLLFGKIGEDEDEENYFVGEYDSCSEHFGFWEGQYDRSTLGFLGSEFYEYASVVAWMPIEPYVPETNVGKMAESEEE